MEIFFKIRFITEIARLKHAEEPRDRSWGPWYFPSPTKAGAADALGVGPHAGHTQHGHSDGAGPGSSGRRAEARVRAGAKAGYLGGGAGWQEGAAGRSQFEGAPRSLLLQAGARLRGAF